MENVIVWHVKFWLISFGWEGGDIRKDSILAFHPFWRTSLVTSVGNFILAYGIPFFTGEQAKPVFGIVTSVLYWKCTQDSAICQTGFNVENSFVSLFVKNGKDIMGRMVYKGWVITRGHCFCIITWKMQTLILGI